MEQLNKQIEEQADEQDIVEDLNIEGVKITKFTEEMAALFTKHQSLLGLAFEKCGLTTLEGFPKLKKLQNLEFQNNSLTGTSIKYIADNFKELINLNLSQNNIKSVDDLKPLASLTKLESLELKDNPLTKEAGYHKRCSNLSHPSKCWTIKMKRERKSLMMRVTIMMMMMIQMRMIHLMKVKKMMKNQRSQLSQSRKQK